MSAASSETKTIFMQALDQPTLIERTAYLDTACLGNSALRRRVDALLRAHDQADPLLDRQAVEHLSGDIAEAAAASELLTFLGPSARPGSLGRLGHYEVLEVAGRGGAGIVFRALDEKLQRIVAIKALAPQIATSSSARQRFVREARAAAAVTHDNVVAIYAVEEDGPVPYLVMQFIEGPSLQEKLDAKGPLPLKEILRIGLHIADGLAAAHRHGLVHRDVKPANILLENGVERVKITDFGLARAGDDASLTQSGVLAGTPMFMSPEQAQGENVDSRSDLFSLGSVLYAMCTGHPPFRAPSTVAVLKRVCEETPRSVRHVNADIPQWLDELIQRLHAKSPAGRWPSAKEVAELLAERLAELHSQAKSAASSNVLAKPVDLPARRPQARYRWLLAAAVLLPLLVGLGLSEATGVTDVHGTVIRLLTGEGTLVVEVDDPAVSVSVVGEDVVISGAGVRELRLKPGQYQVQATKEGSLIRQELVSVTKNGRQVLRVTREPVAASVPDDPEARAAAAWERKVVKLKPEQQLRAVALRLRELNPAFDGRMSHRIESDAVTELRFSTEHVTDISPVHALQKLKVLQISGPYISRGVLADLSPLAGLQLTHLDCGECQIRDLTPLAGMPLTDLRVYGTQVADLSPLRGMPLTLLHVTRTNVKSLAPLAGMSLVELQAEIVPISDLEPIRGMPIRHLGLFRTNVKDLGPLAGMPIDYLNLTAVPASDISPLASLKKLSVLVMREMPVSDLAPLAGLPLKHLHITHTKVSDTSALKGMPLQKVELDFVPGRDTELLRSFPELVEINGLPTAEFWKQQAAVLPQ